VDGAGGETILVVEDDRSVRHVTARMLERLDYTVLQASDVAQAIRVLKTSADIRLLLTDVVMPGGLSGPELAGHVRKTAPEIKILYMSGYTANAMDRLEAGEQLIDKPFSAEQLSLKIRDLLRS